MKRGASRVKEASIAFALNALYQPGQSHLWGGDAWTVPGQHMPHPILSPKGEKEQVSDEQPPPSSYIPSKSYRNTYNNKIK